MTKGEAKALETEVVIFPMKFNNDQEINPVDDTTEKNIVEQQSVKTDIRLRFARLKKSLRKRSASIL